MKMPPEKFSVEDIYRKYGNKIENQIGSSDLNNGNRYSREYQTFKQEMVPEISKYEKWCRSLGSVLKINVSKNDEVKIRRSIQVAHLDIEPSQALTLSVMAFLAVFSLGAAISGSV